MTNPRVMRVSGIFAAVSRPFASMARSLPRAGFSTALCVAVLSLAALAAPSVPSAHAQFGNIFNNSPPRPPASVGDQRGPAPAGAPTQMPPEEMDDEDQPPPQRPVAPPPRARQQQQPQGGFSSQSLPPPSGGVAAPAQQAPQQQQPPTAAVQPGQAAPPQAAPVQPGVRPQTAGRGTPLPANVAPQPGDEVVVEPPSQKISNPTAVFAGLDKITGRIISFDVQLNETVQFGALQVTPRVCYTRPPTENANTDTFVEVNEVTLQGEVKRIFAGWMFASSPGLHAVEHPIYDVWLTACKGGTSVVADTTPPVNPAPAAARPPARAPAANTARTAAPPPQQQQQQMPPPPFGFPTQR
jgi:hypothetical protein